MKTLLLLMYLSGNTTVPVNAMENVAINQKVYNEIINLSNISLTKTEINLYYLNDYDELSQDILKEEILSEVYANNRYVQEFNDIYNSVIYDNPNDWKIMGYSFKLPELNASPKKYSIKLSPSSDETRSKFTGMLFIDVVLENSGEGITKPEDENINIELSQDRIKIKVDEKAYVKIENFNELENVKLNLINTKIVSYKINQEGVIELIGLKVGEAKIAITASNSNKEKSLYVEVEKSNNSLDLNDLIINKDLGQINEDTVADNYKLMDLIIEKNKDTISNDEQIKSFKVNTTINNENKGYSSLIITGDGDVFSGEVKITYKVNIKLNVNHETRQTRVDAYNSTQNDDVYHTIEFKPVLGVNKLKDSYKSLNINSHIYMWDNDNGNYHGSPSNGEKYSTELLMKSVGNQLSGEQEIENSKYIGSVNWMKNDITFQHQIKDNKVILYFHVKSSAYASAVNAMWARAAAKLWIDNIEFVLK